MKIALVLLVVTCLAAGQRITTIQLDGVQYFVSRMNPYSPELNYFLAYQYCRSLGLQLASFETKEKADTMTQYLKNAGYTKYDFWTSGNKLGTDMFLWMSTGLPFNATFDYMARRSNRDVPPGTEPQRVARESGDSGSADGCVALKSPTLSWEAQDCTLVKDFICEQTRCYYYNYGSIPVSATQGNRRPYLTTTTPQPETDRDEADRLETEEQHEQHEVTEPEEPTEVHEEEDAGEVAQPETEIPEDPVVGRLMSTVSAKKDNGLPVEKTSRPDDIPNITSLFTKNPGVQTRIESLFEGLETHDIRTLQRQKATERAPEYHTDYDATEATETEIGQTIGPYDSSPDYVNDQPEVSHDMSKDQEEDASTILPDAEPAYRYNIKVRSNGKVLDPPSK